MGDAIPIRGVKTKFVFTAKMEVKTKFDFTIVRRYAPTSIDNDCSGE